jgi:uncharacterized protein YcfJ
MKKQLCVAVIAALGLASGGAMAATYGDRARVIDSTPIYEQVAAPRQQCWAQPVTAYETRRVVREVPGGYYEGRDGGIGAGTVIGAVLGGVIGHQFGHSTGGRDRGTAAGAVVGGLLGHQIENQSAGAAYYPARSASYVERVPVTQEVQRCRTVAQAEQRIVGYDVRYEYAGREYHTQMDHRPGRTLAVDVAMHVRPADARLTAYRPGPALPVYVRGY